MTKSALINLCTTENIVRFDGIILSERYKGILFLMFIGDLENRFLYIRFAVLNVRSRGALFFGVEF